MATKVVMAQLSPTMEEGKLVEWKLAEGDPVSQGDIVAEIETDKANMDVEAMGSGVLRKILVQEGVTVPVGTLIGVIADPEEDIEPILADAAAAEAPAAPPAAAPTAEPVAAPAVEPAVAAPAGEPAPGAPAADVPPVVPAARDGRVKASPVARKMAAELGIALGTIPGSGPGGRIIKQDVEAAAAAGAPAAGAAVAGAAAATPGAGGIVRPAALGEGRLRDERIEASQMRKAIARRLAESIGPVPHFFLTTEVDMERALDLRVELNAGLDGFKIGVTDILLKTAAEALVRHPEVNASWEGSAIHHHGRVDLGIAVALEGGLITPVLRDADRKGLRQIAEEVAELIERAR
ncbi:MAG: dihydrolipoamide acetyltransferase family protein, partial [Gemmatimonadota bacterium]